MDSDELISLFKEILLTPPDCLSQDSKSSFQNILKEAPSPILFKLRSLLEIMRGQIIASNYTKYSIMITSLLDTQDKLPGRRSPDILEPVTEISVLNPIRVTSGSDAVEISTGTSIWALYLKRQLLDKNRIDQRQMLSAQSMKFIFQKMTNKALHYGFQSLFYKISKNEILFMAMKHLIRIQREHYLLFFNKLKGHQTVSIDLTAIKFGLYWIESKLNNCDKIKLLRKLRVWYSISPIECSFSSIDPDSRLNKGNNIEEDLSKMLGLHSPSKEEKVHLIVKMSMERAELRYFYVKSRYFNNLKTFRREDDSRKGKEKDKGKIMQKNKSKTALRSGNNRGRNMYNVFKDKYLKTVRIYLRKWTSVGQSQSNLLMYMKILMNALGATDKRLKTLSFNLIIKQSADTRLKLQTIKGLGKQIKKIITISFSRWKQYLQLEAITDKHISEIPFKFIFHLSRTVQRSMKTNITQILQHSQLLLKKGFHMFVHNYYTSEIDTINAGWKWKLANADTKWYMNSKKASVTSTKTIDLFSVITKYVDNLKKFGMSKLRRVWNISKALKKIHSNHQKTLKHVFIKWNYSIQTSRSSALQCYRYSLKNLLSIYTLNILRCKSKIFHSFERQLRFVQTRQPK